MSGEGKVSSIVKERRVAMLASEIISATDKKTTKELIDDIIDCFGIGIKMAEVYLRDARKFIRDKAVDTYEADLIKFREDMAKTQELALLKVKQGKDGKFYPSADLTNFRQASNDVMDRLHGRSMQRVQQQTEVIGETKPFDIIVNGQMISEESTEKIVEKNRE